MKKIAVILSVALIISLFAGCEKSTQKNNSSLSSSFDESQVTTSITENSSIIDTSVQTPADESQVTTPITEKPPIIDTSGLTPAKNPLSLKEVKSIFEPLLNLSIEVYETIGNAPNFPTGTPALYYHNYHYFEVPEDSFKTLNDVWEYAYSAFTKQAAERLFSYELNPDSDIPRYIEKDGKLYFTDPAHGRSVRYDMDTVTIIQQYNDMIIVSVDVYILSDVSPEKAVYAMCKTEDGWRMANSESEAINILPDQFLPKNNPSEQHN